MVWPLAGVVARDYAVTAYMDDDPSAGRRDYMGFTGDDAITYDGHDGIDIAISGFEKMDEGVSVLAGFDGVVQSAEDGAPDRNTSETAQDQKARANDIVLAAPNGFTVAYWHLKKGSVLVKAGDRVKAGQTMAELGSSGQSGGPHVHISAYDCRGTAIDMMANHVFTNAPPYDPPADLMSATFSVAPDLSSSNRASSSAVGQTVYVSYLFSAIRRGDHVGLTATPKTGQALVLSAGSEGPRQIAQFFWKPRFVLNSPGTWTISTSINDRMVDRRTWEVGGP
jgi:murein DD-endopeptidase MepM/ murein hydrolase activator NlpD